MLYSEINKKGERSSCPKMFAASCVLLPRPRKTRVRVSHWEFKRRGQLRPAAAAGQKADQISSLTRRRDSSIFQVLLFPQPPGHVGKGSSIPALFSQECPALIRPNRSTVVGSGGWWPPAWMGSRQAAYTLFLLAVACKPIERKARQDRYNKRKRSAAHTHTHILDTMGILESANFST